MSHSSPDRFVAVLGATAVGLARWRGSTHQWLGSVAFSAERGQAWSLALDTLQLLLAEHAARGASLSLVLSVQFCRFCLVPWSMAITRVPELQGYARACFEDHYGHSLEGWQVLLSAEPAGCARIGAAVPEALVQRANAMGLEAGLRVRSVQPYLMSAFNFFAPELEYSDFLFVLAEPQRSVSLLARAGRWVQVRAQGGVDSDAALQALLGRECELQAGQGEAALNLYLHAPGRVHPRPLLDGVALCELPQPTETATDVLCTMSRAVV